MQKKSKADSVTVKDIYSVPIFRKARAFVYRVFCQYPENQQFIADYILCYKIRCFYFVASVLNNKLLVFVTDVPGIPDDAMMGKKVDITLCLCYEQKACFSLLSKQLMYCSSKVRSILFICLFIYFLLYLSL